MKHLNPKHSTRRNHSSHETAHLMSCHCVNR